MSEARICWDELYELPAQEAPDRQICRGSVDARAAARLQRRLAEEGVRQPLVVCPRAAPGPRAGPSGDPCGSGGYVILDGRKRWRAACALVRAERWAFDVELPCRIVSGGESHV